jgi:NAD(P)H-hydrate repair Nnr-like enzyme with NAD(P)H-hydrate dehydratase domain
MDYWKKQTSEKPLYGDLMWDKPERKDQAGKLLIIGGNLHGFASPAKAYVYTNDAGVGDLRIALPQSLASALKTFWTNAVFCPATPSGSFSHDALDLVLQNALWADGIMLAGDFGRNSETSILLEKLSSSYSGLFGVTRDGLDYFTNNPALLLDRPNTLIVGSFAQIQKLCIQYGFDVPITFSMDLMHLVGALHVLTSKVQACIVLTFQHTFIVAYKGEVSTTPDTSQNEIWRLETTAKAIVNMLHYPAKYFQAATQAVIR